MNNSNNGGDDTTSFLAAVGATPPVQCVGYITASTTASNASTGPAGVPAAGVVLPADSDSVVDVDVTIATRISTAVDNSDGEKRGTPLNGDAVRDTTAALESAESVGSAFTSSDVSTTGRLLMGENCGVIAGDGIESALRYHASSDLHTVEAKGGIRSCAESYPHIAIAAFARNRTFADVDENDAGSYDVDVEMENKRKIKMEEMGDGHEESEEHLQQQNENQMEQCTKVKDEAGSELVGRYQKCIREGCTNRAVFNPEWDDEYCSHECVNDHCKAVFYAWVARRM